MNGDTVGSGGYVRAMTDSERAGWAMALRIARRYDEDEATDRLCTMANNAESRSLSLERHGNHDVAVAQWRLSELYDAAVCGLV